MIPTEGVYIELRSDEPERLAAFYERLFGLERETGAGVVLSSPRLTLAIKPSLGEAPEEGGVVFGFRVPDGSDPSSLRASAIADGAVMLSESKRDNLATLSCQDPDGNVFVLVAVQPSVGAEAAPAVRVVSPPVIDAPVAARPAAPSVTPAPSPPPSAAVPRASAVVPRPTVPPAGNRPTRREVDRLRDMDRLASMAESIAGLSTPFSEDDPSHVMDRMRAKIPVVTEAELRAREADAELRAREKQAAVDDLLSQYRSQVRGESTPPSPSVSPVEPPPVAPSPVAQAAPPPVVSPAPKIDDDPVLADLDSPHTLGPSTVGSSDEIDPIQSEAPRTLGRSRAYDDDEDVSAS